MPRREPVMLKFQQRIASVLGLGLALSACSSDDEPARDAKPQSFVLVHGAWMGAWSWNDVVPELEAMGSSATAVELPAHGDSTEPVSAATLDAYVAAVSDAVDRASAPVVLVGHSMAGIVITEVA